MQYRKIFESGTVHVIFIKAGGCVTNLPLCRISAVSLVTASSWTEEHMLCRWRRSLGSGSG